MRKMFLFSLILGVGFAAVSVPPSHAQGISYATYGRLGGQEYVRILNSGGVPCLWSREAGSMPVTMEGFTFWASLDVMLMPVLDEKKGFIKTAWPQTDAGGHLYYEIFWIRKTKLTDNIRETSYFRKYGRAPAAADLNDCLCSK